MTPTRSKIHRSVVLSALLAAACATTPLPVADLDDARAAIARAEAAGAERDAPVELRFARDKLGRAQAAADAKDGRQAAALAQQAEADAELALARSRHARARADVQARRDENERLRRELLDGDEAR
jgi:hypothetical protein